MTINVGEDSVLSALRRLMDASDHLTPNPVRAHEFRPGTWQRWMDGSPAAMKVVDGYVTADSSAGGRISRADLASLAATIDDEDHDSLVQLFVATMIWGSGTSNGRGPRNTAAALGDERLVPSLVDSRQLILDNKPAEAYTSFRSRGVGPAFFTKWFWAVGLDRQLDPTPLILDARVWASLKALGWDSRRAAGSARRAKRYTAYLESMERWTAACLPGVATPDQLEQVIFLWAGERGR